MEKCGEVRGRGSVAMRIVAGTARGRVLAAPKRDDVIRPTADRVRETLFNVLGQWCEGLEVLDVFAGTGALALEALSRGAVKAVCIDSGREAQALIRQNAEALGFTQALELLPLPAEKGLAALAKQGRRFHLVFSDPPYRLEAGTMVLEQLGTLGLLHPEATVVVEHAKGEVLAEQVGALTRVDERRFGDTVVSLYRTASSG